MVGNAHYTLFFEKSNISVRIEESGVRSQGSGVRIFVGSYHLPEVCFFSIIKNNLKNLIIMYPEFLHIRPI